VSLCDKLSHLKNNGHEDVQIVYFYTGIYHSILQKGNFCVDTNDVYDKFSKI
jgi:hypothetical protein